MAMTANIAAVQSAGSAPASPVVAGIGATVKEGVAKALQAGNAGNALAGVNSSASQTIYGGYSGSAAFSLNLNQTTGEFSGSITFSNYCELAGTASISGSVGISGVFNLNTSSFNSLTMSFNPLSASLNNATSSLYGSIGFSIQGNSETMTISCTVTSGGATYWLRDWTFTLTSTSMTISGQYYDPQYGYVDITTPTPLTVGSLSSEPNSGVVLFTGANGSRARMTFNNSGYTVSVDANGTGNWVAVQ
ncbi:hypothetical protein L4X63_08200 [Geomonas sp. Red32]|uniref:hypothetical protein n=1 Tax=Geomonas sp. Red32 TaxID=2912856 RepID=UPI00202CD71B|nr:hypothetical protein [Geomonas sp. Red32]MCM0081565.1 hypothetical protein [Geomonas sp. Red32]